MASGPPVHSLFDLTGRSAIVTGGSRGLGFEIAEGLAEAGASLMVCARREEWLRPAVEELQARGFAVEGMTCDVSRARDVQHVLERTIDAYGKVDILVNNAGVTWGAEPQDMPLEKWQKVIDTNLTGTFLFSQAAARDMLTRGWGRIINVSSAAAFQASITGPHYAGYAASKAALIGLTRELAATWGRDGIRVNAIAPGYFHTRLTELVLKDIRPRLEAATPLGRVGRDGEIKGVAVFLASDASNFITGEAIVVDGGASIASA